MLLFSQVLPAQPNPLTIEWQKSLGGSRDDIANSIVPTSDGGYIVVGKSTFTDSGVDTTYSSYDSWIVKLTNIGVVEWQLPLGGSDYDEALRIAPTHDGGYIVAGVHTIADGDMSKAHGALDVWIVKLTSVGAVEWQQLYGGSKNDWAASIEPTSDGGYIIAGSSASTDGDVAGHHGTSVTSDFWIVKLTSTGIIEWQRSLGGSSTDAAASIKQTIDGGYIVAGSGISTDGDITGNHGHLDYWIVKLTSTGGLEWQRSFGGGSADYATSVALANDGGYIVAGVSYSYGSIAYGRSRSNYWIVKLTNVGKIEWQKSLGGSFNEAAASIVPTSDGGYIVAGHSYSSDGDVTGNHGAADAWIVKLTSAGVIEWEKSLGGGRVDATTSIVPTSDGGYIVAGYSDSNDGDVTGNYGEYDYWIVKLAPPTSSAPTFQPEPSARLSEITIQPNPAQNSALLKIETTAEAEYTIELISPLGEVVRRQRVHLGIGEQEVHLRDMELFPAGSYEVVGTRGSQPFARGRLVLLGE
ncbi:MAG: T9SS C-terminal target domain-containing protein [Armatimonadetes bacterium]|nr:T9SS C-terminal target domain-containing protein [Armatimonadota bacterium]